MTVPGHVPRPPGATAIDVAGHLLVVAASPVEVAAAIADRSVPCLLRLFYEGDLVEVTDRAAVRGWWPWVPVGP